MKVKSVKRQKQIREFLAEEFGADRGSALADRQEEIFRTLVADIKGKSENQKKTLIQTILPCIALYKILQQEGFSQEDAYACTQKYMFDVVGGKMHSSMKRMELVPGFYQLYSAIFCRVMRTTDLQESVQERGREYFDVTIRKCLWHTTCAELGCAEMCRIFCDTDNVTYGNLKKMGFARTKTLGQGCDCCDFHFFKK